MPLSTIQCFERLYGFRGVVPLVVAIVVALGGFGTPARLGPADGDSLVSEDWLAQAHRSIARDEYTATMAKGALQAPNRAHDLRTWFEPDGVRVQERRAAEDSTLVGLRLATVGRDGHAGVIGPGEVSSDGNRVEIRRPGLTEWYVNAAAGLEQGFTFEDRPGGNGALVLELSVEQARASLRGDEIILETAVGRHLHYGGLVANDATGRILVAHMEVPTPDRIRLVVDDAQAIYPVIVDPVLTQLPSEIDGDQADSELGFSVASAGDMDGDGHDDVIVGARFYDRGEADEGAAFIFLGRTSTTGISGNPSSALGEIEGNQPNAHLGSAVAAAGDINGDGYGDVIVGAPGYDGTLVDEGAAFIFHGGPVWVVGDPTSADARLWGAQADAEFGDRVAGAGDVDNDGYDDVIVGAPLYDGSIGADEGGAFVFLGSASGTGDGTTGTADAEILAAQAGAELGRGVAGAGDVDGDGYADVLAGGPAYDSGESNEGAVFVFRGGPSGVTGGTPVSADAQLEGDQIDAAFGDDVASAGDVDGDGYDDVIVGAPGYDAGELDEGAAFVFLGGAAGIAGAGPNTAHAQLEGDQGDSGFGEGVASADVDADGYSDVIVGASRYDENFADEGAVFLFRGGVAGISGSNPATAAESRFGKEVDARMGRSVAAAGDVNDDGYPDVIVGAFRSSLYGNHAGRAHVFLGFHGFPAATVYTPATAHARLQANEAGAHFAIDVSTAGDVNGDGYDDVIVGAYEYDGGIGAGGGAAFVFLGGANGVDETIHATLRGQQSRADMGASVAGAGDVNGDGYDDVIVGAPRHEADHLAGSTDDNGGAFIFHGSPTGIADQVGPSAADTWIEGDLGSNLGAAVDAAGDVNGDGYDDVIVGAPLRDLADGAAFVFLGGPSGIADGSPATADTRLLGGAEGPLYQYIGVVVEGLGDINGDGYDDVLMASPDFRLSGVGRPGGAFLFLGSATGIPDGDTTTADTRLIATGSNDQFGMYVTADADLNGDGYGDIGIGAQGSSGHPTDAMYLYYGSAVGIPDGGPETADALFDFTSSLVGDVNGDGYDDLAVLYMDYEGEDGSNHGNTLVLPGGPAGPPSDITNAFVWFMEGKVFSSGPGDVAVDAGDVNGDGYGDLLVGSVGYSIVELREGVAFVVLGSQPPLSVTECNDGIDNDNDGLVNLDDPGCEDASDPDEHSETLECDNGMDDDLAGDGIDKWDPGCNGPGGANESPECQDGIDNDGDGKIDADGGDSIHGFAIADPDPQCGTFWRNREAKSNSCGVGPELVPGLVLLGLLRRRRVLRLG